MTFWLFLIPALALSAAAVGLVALGLWRGAQLRAAEPGQSREMRIYADQLKEIERDQARGLIPEDEAGRLRAETARRLLEADRRAVTPLRESPPGMKALALVLLVAVPVLAGLAYRMLGVPGMIDYPLAQRFDDAAELRAARPPQVELEAAWLANPARPQPPAVEPQYLTLMEQLREAITNRPNDQRGLRLLAVNEANLGNFAASAAAWERLVVAQGPDVPVEDLVALIEAMALAANGTISAEAESVIEVILQRDPRNGAARYYLGLMFSQTQRPDLTFRLWRGLLEDSNPDDPWVPPIRSVIEELAQVAGVRYTLPPETAGGRGPSASDMQAAADMTEAERQEMIGGMVEGLAARLANGGGPAEDWARLIGALGVLGQADRARAIWAEARLVFADRPQDLALIDAAAQAQGFTE